MLYWNNENAAWRNVISPLLNTFNYVRIKLILITLHFAIMDFVDFQRKQQLFP
jgi:hypothetical protein